MFMKNRKYGRTPELSVDKITTALESLTYIKTAFLFGSRVTGSQNPKSDYDFAFEMSNNSDADWGMQAKAWMDICDLLNLKEYDVDVVDLSHTDTLLKKTIREHHILLKGDPNDISRLLS